jgi:hypothetical protein
VVVLAGIGGTPWNAPACTRRRPVADRVTHFAATASTQRSARLPSWFCCRSAVRKRESHPRCDYSTGLMGRPPRPAEPPAGVGVPLLDTYPGPWPDFAVGGTRTAGCDATASHPARSRANRRRDRLPVMPHPVRGQPCGGQSKRASCSVGDQPSGGRIVVLCHGCPPKSTERASRHRSRASRQHVLRTHHRGRTGGHNMGRSRTKRRRPARAARPGRSRRLDRGSFADDAAGQRRPHLPQLSLDGEARP